MVLRDLSRKKRRVTFSVRRLNLEIVRTFGSCDCVLFITTVYFEWFIAVVRARFALICNILFLVRHLGTATGSRDKCVIQSRLTCLTPQYLRNVVNESAVVQTGGNWLHHSVIRAVILQLISRR